MCTRLQQKAGLRRVCAVAERSKVLALIIASIPTRKTFWARPEYVQGHARCVSLDLICRSPGPSACPGDRRAWHHNPQASRAHCLEGLLINAKHPKAVLLWPGISRPFHTSPMQQCSQLAYQLALISQIIPSGVICIISLGNYAALVRYVYHRKG